MAVPSICSNQFGAYVLVVVISVEPAESFSVARRVAPRLNVHTPMLKRVRPGSIGVTSNPLSPRVRRLDTPLSVTSGSTTSSVVPAFPTSL
jgi:hypothetical protein